MEKPVELAEHAFADPRGVVQFRADVYGRDPALVAALAREPR